MLPRDFQDYAAVEVGRRLGHELLPFVIDEADPIGFRKSLRLVVMQASEFPVWLQREQERAIERFLRIK